MRKQTEHLQRVNEHLAQKYRTLRAVHAAMASSSHLASERLAVEDSAFLSVSGPPVNAREQLRRRLLVLTRERKFRLAVEQALRTLEDKLAIRSGKLAMVQGRGARRG